MAKNYDIVLLHSGKLLEYPNNPFAEEALIMRAEVQFNQQQMAKLWVLQDAGKKKRPM